MPDISRGVECRLEKNERGFHNVADKDRKFINSNSAWEEAKRRDTRDKIASLARDRALSLFGLKEAKLDNPEALTKQFKTTNLGMSDPRDTDGSKAPRMTNWSLSTGIMTPSDGMDRTSGMPFGGK